MNNPSKKLDALGAQIQESLRLQCATNTMPITRGFLCSSVSLLEPPEPISVLESASVADVMRILQKNKIGCVLVVNGEGELSGIFSERDYVLKIFDKDIEDSTPVAKYMTREPITISLDETIAFALTLMSQGGFRHLPITDETNQPVGMVSIKNIVDHLSNEIFESLMAV